MNYFGSFETTEKGVILPTIRPLQKHYKANFINDFCVKYVQNENKVNGKFLMVRYEVLKFLDLPTIKILPLHFIG